MPKVARLIASVAVAGLVTFAQIQYLRWESSDLFDGSPLYSHYLLRVLSCGVVAGLAAVGTSHFLRSSRPSLGQSVAGAAVSAALVAVLFFEGQYACSGLPVISPVSLALAFRPWTRLVTPTLVLSFVVWLAIFLWDELGWLSPPTPGPESSGPQ